MRITTDEFLDKLRVKARTEVWELIDGRNLRTRKSCQCPIEFVAALRGKTAFAYEIGLDLGLSKEDAATLIAAADNYMISNQPDALRLRRQMLAICGVSED